MTYDFRYANYLTFYVNRVGLLVLGFRQSQSLYQHETINTHKRRHMYIRSRAGFEPTISVSKWQKVVHALHFATTVWKLYSLMRSESRAVAHFLYAVTWYWTSKPRLDNVNPPEGHIIFKDSPDGRTYAYVYQNWGGGLNSLEYMLQLVYCTTWSKRTGELIKPHAVTTCADFIVAWYSLITGN
jgi:hypothetical protein